MKNYFEEFYNRYESLKSDLGIEDIAGLKPESLTSLLKKESKDQSDSRNAQTLNNLFMAGLGMGTLYLRMGAVLMIAEKTKEGAEPDVSFLKVMADKLIHKLPADGEWKDIWTAYLTKHNDSKWYKIVDDTHAIPNYNGKIYESFVTFRNNIVHQELIVNSGLTSNQIVEALSGLRILDAMSEFRQIFKDCKIIPENNEVYFQYSSGEEKLKISPFVQINKSNEPEEVGILPYLFQGRYYKGAKFINTEGVETKEEKDDSLDQRFDSIKSEIDRFNGDKAFNFDEKIKTYNDWCIGRENEVNTILNWIKDAENDKNVLPIFAPAGLGKGALIAKLIQGIQGKIPVMYHFCGSGKTNNLHSILYHFVLQGQKMPGMNGVSVWDPKDEKINSQLRRLPTQYNDTIKLFQELLSNCFSLPEKYQDNPLVIIIDGLDETAVADHSKRISDWFYTFDEKGERKEKWKSPDHIKWIFTYRQTAKENKEGFQFEYHEFNTHKLPVVQPMNGLTEEVVKKALKIGFKDFEPALTDEFLETIIKKGAVK